MPTLLTHPAVPLAIGLGMGTQFVSRRLLVAGIAASILPDVDLASLWFDLSRYHFAAHRGLTHSLFFAACVGLLARLSAARLRSTPRAAFLFVFVAGASHGLLDMLTNGGAGVALFWPLMPQRFFFTARVIGVSPITITQFFDRGGATVLLSELTWVWLPAALACAAPRLFGGSRAR